jgi:peptide/nickel transport system substrate-binding protein
MNIRPLLQRIALAALLFLPAAGRAETTLRFVPLGDLRVLDPIWTSAAITLSHGQMIYDVLLTMDAALKPQPQMAESYTASPDGMRWTFVLRPGLVFHDGSPVRAQDAVASIDRWATRVTAGQALMSRAASSTAQDARTIELVFNRPYGPVLESLASPVLAAFVMREQDAKVDAFQQVKTTIGSGPFTFVQDAYVPGNKVVYRRFDGYVPRREPADGYAGGKVAKVDGVEWIYLPDTATATNALRTGEVDFLEAVPPDLLPLLRDRPEITVQVLNTAGSIGNIRPNTAHPPFSDPRARQALLLAVDQPSYATALAGSPELGHACYAVFVCGTPYETDVATDPWRHVDFARAKQLLADSGYTGRPIVLLDPVDQPDIHLIAQLTADALKKIGAAVDLQSMDRSTVITRRNTREPPSRNPAGWDLAFTLWGGFSLSSPITNTPLVTTCDGKNLYGWPCDDEIERLRSAFLDATTQEARMKVIEALQTRYYQVVPYVNTGIFQRAAAYRSNLHGVLPTFYPVMWNIEKSAK